MTPVMLLGLTALVSAARALTLPGFAAAVPGAATRAELPKAVGLYSISNNIGRMVGPALAGFVIAAASIQASYLVGLLAVAAACVGIARSQPSATPHESHARPGFRDALVEGIRYCLHTPSFRNVLARVVVFFACAVSVHSLLPILMTDAHWFGLAWAAYGGGAILTATVFPALVARLDTRSQLTAGIVAHSCLLVIMAWLPFDAARIAVMCVLGASWYVVISSSQLAIQRATPDRFRARGLGFLSMTLMGGFAVGSACWGAIARGIGPSGAMTVSAVVSLVGLAATFRLVPAAAQERAGATG
jgi:predicted MFS family arabinose efflux permease